MNKGKLFTGLSLVATCAAGLWVLFDSESSHFLTSMENVVVFDTTAGSDADEIRVVHSVGVEMTFRREGNEWVVVVGNSSWPMKPEKIQALFHSPGGDLELRRHLQLVTSPEEIPSPFWDQAGTTVTFLRDDKPIETLIIGRVLRKGDALRTEVRRRGQEHYYLASGNLADNFAGDTLSDWIEAGFFPDIEPGEVVEIRVQTGSDSESYELRRSGGDSKWTLEAGGTFVSAHEERSSRLLLTLLHLGPLDFPSNSSKTTVTATIEVVTRQGETHSLFVGEETEPGSGVWLAWNSESDRPRTIYWPLAVLRDPSELAGVPPAHP